jgi:hypothetical protein
MTIEINDKQYIPNYSSDITLGEMGERDIDNFEHLMKKATIHSFPDYVNALIFQLYSMHTILHKHGVQICEGAKAEEINKLLAKHKMRIEHRTEYAQDEPVYMNGLYIYKGNQEQIWKENEIVGFVSNPYRNMIIIEPTYYVKRAMR